MHDSDTGWHRLIGARLSSDHEQRKSHSMSQASFAKRQREKAKREKAAEKAAKRARRSEEQEEESPSPPVDEQALLAELADLHERFDNDAIDFEDFNAAKEEIVEKLQMD